jgi:hypothetical protein
MSDTNQSNGALPVRSMDEILAELDQRGQPERHEVKVPEWGAVFYVRGLTRAEVLHIDRISTSRKGRRGQGRARPRNAADRRGGAEDHP